MGAGWQFYVSVKRWRAALPCFREKLPSTLVLLQIHNSCSCRNYTLHLQEWLCRVSLYKIPSCNKQSFLVYSLALWGLFRYCQWLYGYSFFLFFFFLIRSWKMWVVDMVLNMLVQVKKVPFRFNRFYHWFLYLFPYNH